MELSQAENIILNVHDKNAGITSKALSNLVVTKGGRQFSSPYDCLINVVKENNCINVMDLACGDGYLLSLLSDKTFRIGIDFSSGELREAKLRSGNSATYLQAKAQNIPVASKSIDYILCHMALMIMSDIDVVFSEVCRVLKSGALFSSIIDAGPSEASGSQLFVNMLPKYLRQEGCSPIRIRDRRLRTIEGIKCLYQNSFDELDVQLVKSNTRFTPEEMWNWFSDCYEVRMMNEEVRNDFKNEYLSDLKHLLDTDHKLEHMLQFYHVTASVL